MSSIFTRKVFFGVLIFFSFDLLFYYIPSKISEEFSDNTQNKKEIYSTNLRELPRLWLVGTKYSHNEYKFPLSKATPKAANDSKSKTILIWNSYWASTALWQKIFFEIVYKQCPQSSCVLTVNRSELSSADAVLFHLPNFNTKQDLLSLPKVRDPRQIWIAMSYEPPYILQNNKVKLSRLNNIFNRTMTLRSDSDIVARHGTFLKITKDTEFPNYMFSWYGSHDGTDSKNYAEGKRRLVAWFASSRNCKSQSNREHYVKELQKHIEVDVYGKCGPYKCGTQKTMRYPYKVEHDDCYLLVSVGYKFVLAFENSICQDYVTEKLYNHLKLNVVPVVLGGANYSVYAPPHSVIDASQYTPKELANYLSLLDNNDTLYNEYFAWKKDYYIASHDGIPLACDLCQQLHNPRWGATRNVYKRMDEWLLQGCKPGWEPSGSE